MFTDTPSSPTYFPSVKTQFDGVFSRFYSALIPRRATQSTDHLTDAHYRDLGLPPRTHCGTDIRPVIILGPM